MTTMFGSDFFAGNRRRLANKIQDGVVVLAGHRQMQRRNDTTFTFEQESNFWYLSGLSIPSLHMIYDGKRDRFWLVRPEITEVERIFEGEASDDELIAISGADEVISESQFEDLLRQMTRSHSAVYTVKPQSHGSSRVVFNPALRDLSQRLERTFSSVQDCTNELAQLRAIKQTVEVKAIEKAIRLTTSVFEDVRQSIGNFQYEYQIEAEFGYRFNRANAKHAYDPIVASGKNACTLHYIANSRKIKKGDLVLLDIGAQYNCYAADISRTYAFGDLSKRKANVHQSLQHAQSEIIKQIQPNMPVVEYQKLVDNSIGKMLVELGLSEDGSQDDIRKYMPHAVSHGLGIDVHDSLGKTTTLLPGMVLTVEPGIYIADEGIGIRIEDDVLITDNGTRNLSGHLSTTWL